MNEDFEIVDFPDGYHIHSIGGDSRAIKHLVSTMQLAVAENERERKGPIFHADLNLSDPDGKDFGLNIMYEMFSRGLPGIRRRVSCEICEIFIREFGNLCYLSKDGTLMPLIWPDNDVVPEYYRKAVGNVRKLFEGRPLGKVFNNCFETYKYCSEYRARKAAAKDTYTHTDVNILDRVRNFSAPTESKDLAKVLERIIADNDEKTIGRTYKLLIHDILPHTKVFKPWIIWLKNVIAAITLRRDIKSADRRALVSRYANLAAEGCLPSCRNGELAKLMSIVKLEEDIKLVRSKWTKLVNPKDKSPEMMLSRVSNLMADLKYNTKSFFRTFIEYAQIPANANIWLDALNPVSVPQAFSQSQESPKLSIPPTLRDSLDRAPFKKICFRKFCLQVLPQTSSLSIHLPTTSPHVSSLHFLTTGLDDPSGKTKPIFSFQRPGGHTAAWFKADHIKFPEQANLVTGWNRIRRVLSLPHVWDRIDAPIIPVPNPSPESGTNSNANSTPHQCESAAPFFDPITQHSFTQKNLPIKFLLAIDGIDDHSAKSSDFHNEYLNRDLLGFTTGQIERYRDWEGMRGRFNRGQVGGVVVGGEGEGEREGFRELVLGVRLRSGVCERWRVVAYKYFVE